jgi:hypothetical protein
MKVLRILVANDSLARPVETLDFPAGRIRRWPCKHNAGPISLGVECLAGDCAICGTCES